MVDRYKIKYKEKHYKLEPQTFHPKNFNKVVPIEAFRQVKPKKDLNRSIQKVRYDRVAQSILEFKPGAIANLPSAKFDVNKLNLE